MNNARLEVKSWQSHSSMTSRSRVSGHSACLKSMLRTITMQGLTLTAITASEKYTLMLDDVIDARLGVKSWQSHSSTKCRSRTPVHNACLKSLSRTYITQFFYTPSYHCFRHMHFNAWLDVNCWQMDQQLNGWKFKLLCCTLLQAGAIKTWNDNTSPLLCSGKITVTNQRNLPISNPKPDLQY